MLFSKAALFAALLSGAVSSPTQHNHVLHEKRHAEPKHWIKRSHVPRSNVLPMRIGLTQRNLDRADELMMEVSSPDSPKFGQYYTAHEVIDLFAPAKEAVDAVKNWLVSAGIASHRIGHSINKQWMQFDASAEEAERLLNTKYYVYDHVHSDKSTVACDGYHVPAHLQEHIDYITPGVKLLAGRMAKSSSIARRGFRTNGKAGFSPPVLGKNISMATAQSLAGVGTSMCDQYITPACIATMYNIPQATKAAKGNELGIFEEGDFYAAQDLILFFELFASNIPITTAPILKGIDGGFAPMAVAGGESDLDFQISYPIIYPQNSVLFQSDDLFYSQGLEGGGGFLNTFLDAIDGSYCTYKAYGEKGNDPIDPVYPDPNPLGYQGKLQCGVYKPTNVISISYGENEDDLPTYYQQRQCNEFMKLGLQGTSIVIASGDSGVAARSTDDGNDDGCLGTKGQVFNPDFPASCPYVTALGATYLPTGANATGDHEVAVTRFPSGGGFSNIYAQPNYQKTAVGNYLKYQNPGYPSYTAHGTNNPNASTVGNGIYNRAGRGYPDFAAVGDNVLIILDGAPTLIGGTSASAPVFAAILNRINEERLAKNKTTVGFVNPVLYSNPSVFHDITVGNNSGCGTPGFYAVKGWDPVTGYGTPNYAAMLKLYMSLP